MSKARDLANAGTALGAVTATELGYVDGVTSAIQTQIDAKEATLPSQTGNSGKYLTTNGSAKSWGTVSQYALPTQTGNSGKYLTTDGSAESWGTVSAGPGNLVQIATGTLSGTSVTISSLSGYSELLLVMAGITTATSGSTYGVRINNNSGGNYKLYGGSSANGIEMAFIDTAGTSFYHNRDTNNSANTTIAIKFTNTKTSGFTDVDYNGYVDGDNGQPYNTVYKGIYTVSEAVSSLVIMNYGNRNFTNGTYTLYGA